ncbi:regulator of telomere elongation helicase 1-like [Lineus longissimus]|uniref:regulator of telomere elongation helicase 1-like n=1 Tax=Lineus longissimus TaxID=88925 RepID=UPI00315D979B
MPPINISGVNVEFPFVPYPCQVDYMTKLIECLKTGVNGILESPTGTGKTLCLLCATLGWLEHTKAEVQLKNLTGRQLLKDAEPGDLNNEDLMNQLAEATGGWEGRPAAPKVIYASRTHSQLSQAMQELKRTQYNSVKACVLGSREQLCIHPQVSKEMNNSTKVHMCRAKVTARTCHFHNNIDLMKHHFTGKVLDIEDLGKLGEKHKCCPYYTTRELKSEADIIFLPYNYLLDPKSRRANGVELPGNIIIFDEAHNLEKICEDSVSFDLTSHDLASAIEETKELCTRMVELAKDEIESQEQFTDLDDGSSATVGGCDFTLVQAMEIKSTLINLEKELDSLDIPSKGLTKPGHFIFELFEKVNLRFENKHYFLEIVEKILNHVTNEGSRFLTKGNGIAKVADIVKIVFSRDPEEGSSTTTTNHQFRLSKAYKVHIAKEVQDKKKTRKDLWTSTPNLDKIGRTLSYWCFSPGHSMEDLRTHGVRSIILTSGTLSPIESFSMEMGIDFPISLQNPHIIQEHQVFVAAVTKGPDDNKLLSNYDNRGTDEYRGSLGNAVVNFARAVPNGLLMFFPSYPVMTNCIEYWQHTNIFNRITQYKALFVEPRTKAEFYQTMETFYEKINDPSLNGAIFCAVCRGKVSEGLDFADINGRAVVITGLPFPPRMDPKVVLKMAYLDENKNRQNRKSLLGRDWYRQQASRAVNQAIGRVIRHKDDYGAILLCDERFATSESKKQLPSWVQPHLKTISTFGLVMRDLMQFFKAAEIAMPSPLPKMSMPRSAPGCQGASFMPTQTRSGTSPRPPGAGSVESHVASLRASSSQRDLMLSREEEARADSIARLTIQYEMKAPKRPAPKGKKRSLLDALETHTTPNYETEKIASPKMSSSQSALERRMELLKMKKKSMKIKDNSILKPEVKTAAMDYVHKVKSILSTDSYKIFNKAMIEYASKANFESLISTLAALFTEDVNKMDLLRGFYQYVKTQHRVRFCEVCVSITGSAPEASNTSNTHPAASNPEKRRKLDEVSGGSLKFSDVKSSKIAAATSCGYKSEVLESRDTKQSSLGEWSEKSKASERSMMETLFGTARDTVDGASVPENKSRITGIEQSVGGVVKREPVGNRNLGQLYQASDGSKESQSLVEDLLFSERERSEKEEIVGRKKTEKFHQASVKSKDFKSGVGHSLPSKGEKSGKENTTCSVSKSASVTSVQKSKNSVTELLAKRSDSDKMSSKSEACEKTGSELNISTKSMLSNSKSVPDVLKERHSTVSKVKDQSRADVKKVHSTVSKDTKPAEKFGDNVDHDAKSNLSFATPSSVTAGQSSKVLPTKEHVVTSSGDNVPSSVEGGLEIACCACNKAAVVPLRTKTCEHVCCFQCWKKIFMEPTGAPKVCPKCGGAVKRKELAKVNL